MSWGIINDLLKKPSREIESEDRECWLLDWAPVKWSIMCLPAYWNGIEVSCRGISRGAMRLMWEGSGPDRITNSLDRWEVLDRRGSSLERPLIPGANRVRKYWISRNSIFEDTSFDVVWSRQGLKLTMTWNETLWSYTTRAAANPAIRMFLDLATFEKKNGDKTDRQYVSRQTSH